ncbi:unnamed protein product [Bemisia tabaci]|uniref:Methylglutaconyl-CoA hydratase n=1 Tax=Bemisia tabaci TaxID=7038 RepID=A0A9P0CBN6_BEMTA|nr:unnamed protein product [Bemisia tabaci]
MNPSQIVRSMRNSKSLVTRLRAFSTVCELEVDRLKGEDEGIVVMGMYRPIGRNSLNKTMTYAMDCALDNLQGDKEAKVLVVRSLVPKVFCAGADLKERLKLSNEEVSRFVKKLRTMCSKFENLSIPVIGAIDGVALGGGLEIALACDIRTGATNSKVGLVETKLGIIPGAGGTQRLPRLVGTAFAKEMIFTAKIIDGEEAFARGIFNHLVEQNSTDDAAYQKALEIARAITANGPIAVELAKMAINRGSEVDVNSGLAIEGACYERVIPTKDRIEGLKAFNENRRPVYVGE